MKCKYHPKYKAVRKPKSGCNKCEEIFALKIHAIEKLNWEYCECGCHGSNCYIGPFSFHKMYGRLTGEGLYVDNPSYKEANRLVSDKLLERYAVLKEFFND